MADEVNSAFVSGSFDSVLQYVGTSKSQGEIYYTKIHIIDTDPKVKNVNLSL
jgi:hypothetical protein